MSMWNPQLSHAPPPHGQCEFYRQCVTFMNEIVTVYILYKYVVATKATGNEFVNFLGVYVSLN